MNFENWKVAISFCVQWEDNELFKDNIEITLMHEKDHE